MSQPRPLAIGLTAPLLVLALVLSGCGGGEELADAPATSAAPGEAATSAFPAPAHAPDPTATPAQGRRRDLGPVSLVLPKGFEPTGDSSNDSLRLVQFTAADPSAIVEVGIGSGVGSDLDSAATSAVANSPLGLERLDDRDVAGDPTYALSGSDAYTGLYYSVGRPVGADVVELSFAFQIDDPANHALIESVLATVRWTA